MCVLLSFSIIASESTTNKGKYKINKNKFGNLKISVIYLHRNKKQ